MDMEHCWHSQGRSDQNTGARPLVCCHCGVEGAYVEHRMESIPDGHGPHYPLKALTMETILQVYGPSQCQPLHSFAASPA